MYEYYLLMDNVTFDKSLIIVENVNTIEEKHIVYINCNKNSVKNSILYATI
jgi:hypothetical protein